MKPKSLELQVGDEVYSEAFGYGVVTHVLSPVINDFPVKVKFNCLREFTYLDRSFTEWGQYTKAGPDSELDIVKVK